MLKTASIFIVLLFSTLVHANDTTATIAAGGIEYKKNNDISMEEEILKISTNKIDVSYKFQNHSNKEIQETIAFPLPLVPQENSAPDWDEEYIARTLLRADNVSNLKILMSGSAFTDFERSVNGSPHYGYQYHVEAIHNISGSNITKQLRDNNIILSSAFLNGYMEEGELERNAELKNKLKKLNLLDKHEQPVWKTRTTYTWTQSFPANSSLVTTHRYTPRTGFYWLRRAANNPDKLDQEITPSKKLSDYCPTAEDETAILNAFKKGIEGDVLRVNEIQYILTTGANWKGAIKNFRLEIKPPTAKTRVLFCWEGKITKTSDGTLVSTLENFTPKKDLKILFVSIPE